MSTLIDIVPLLDRAYQKLTQKANSKAKKIAREIIKDFLAITPVDKGKLVSNWHVDLGFPLVHNIEAYSLGKKGSTRLQNIAEARKVAYNIISQKQPGEGIYISNDVNYLKYVEKRSLLEFGLRAKLIARHYKGSTDEQQ